VSNLDPWDPSDFAEMIIKWRIAFMNDGFALLTGHGIDQRVFLDLTEQYKHFLAQDTGEKMKYHLGDKSGCQSGGYSPLSKVKGAASIDGGETPHDLVERLQFHSREGMFSSPIPGLAPFPGPNHEQFRMAVQRYFDEITNLMRKIYRIAALSLGLPQDTFLQNFTSSSVGILSLNQYPSISIEKMIPNQYGLGKHTDFLGFTILWQDASNSVHPTLEVERMKETDVWEKIQPIGDALIINAGDLIELWTHGIFKSVMHRVIPRISEERRFSVAFFTGPSLDIEAGSLPQLDSQASILEKVRLNMSIQPGTLISDHINRKCYKFTKSKDEL